MEAGLRETLCDRFIAVAEATGLTRIEFGKIVGLGSSQLSNIANYRNLPSHHAIYRAVEHFGIPVDYFYGRMSFGLERITPVRVERDRRQAWAA
jgi:transcriptional regulator with XRE-family HTH domain